MITARLSRASIALVGLCLLDMLTTLYFVAQGMAVESNPIMDMFLKISPLMFIIAKVISFIPFVIAVEWYRRYNPKFSSIATRCTIAAYLLIYVVATFGVNHV